MGKKRGEREERKRQKGKEEREGLDVSECVRCHFENANKDKGREQAAQKRQGGEEESDGQPSRASAVGAEAETSPFECVHLDLFVLHI